MLQDISSYFMPSRYSRPPVFEDQEREIPGGGVQRLWTPGGGDPTQIMPRCHNQELMLLMVERFMRADAALSSWAEQAKKCVEFVEGRQWSARELKLAEMEDRPLITLNKIAPLIRLVLGYHRQNRVDARYLPTDDSSSSEGVATTLTKIAKHIHSLNEMEYVDAEVFLDGIMTGRGFYDFRLNFEHNDFGEIVATAKDPFTIRPDPDSDQYAVSKWGYYFEARWASIDEVEHEFGRDIASLIVPLLGGAGYRGGVPADILEYIEEKTPWRTFGGHQNNLWSGYGSLESFIANTIDPARKNIRVIDCQHKIRVMQRNIVDLETGDRAPIPTNYTQDQVAKLLMWSAEQYAARGEQCPLRVEWRPTMRVRWTTMIGDIIVHDDWSPYEDYTLVGYFPYFRRGQTRGMVDDLIDSQREINMRRSSEIDTVSRVAHSGWMWHKDSLEEGEKEKIETHGGAPGINIEWKGDPSMKPERIEPGQMPTAIKDLEQAATLDLKEIAGINDSALGQMDRVQSGRAIEARQRQSILGLEMYLDNKRRTKKHCAGKILEMVQNHYTEPRLFKMLGDNGVYSMIGINQRDAVGNILMNVNTGRYTVAIDERPLSGTFLAAQFEELMALIEKGILPVPLVQDIVLDLSTAPQKEVIKMRLNAMMKAQGFITADEMLMMQAAGIPVNPAMLPPMPPPGTPMGGGKPKKEGGGEGGSTTSGGTAPGQNPAPASPGSGQNAGAASVAG